MDIEYREQNYHIRTVIEEDKENFMSIRRETSDLSHAYDTIPGFLDQAWGFVLNGYDEVSMVAFRNGCFVAICTFHDFQGDHVQIGYDVARQLRGQGIGTELAGHLINAAHRVFPDKEVLIRVRKDNVASYRVAEKNGGVIIGFESTPEGRLAAELLQKYERKGETGEEVDAVRKRADEGMQGTAVFKMP